MIGVWLQAFRLRTLPLSLACIGMGSFMAAAGGFFRWPVFALAGITTIFLQILSNLANDYGDSVHGADHAGRQGPARTVQSGAISAAQMKRAVALFTILSLVSGLSLLVVAFGNDWISLLRFFGLGLASILAAIGYTMGKKPYGYLGLGDVSVLLFFGLAGVLGSLYLFAHNVRWLDALPALSCGLLSVGVLNINNMRDIKSDRAAGKFSIPVRIGKKNAAIYQVLLLAGANMSAILFVLIDYRSPLQFLFLVTLPAQVHIAWGVIKRPSQQLDPYLRKMALAALAFVLFFGAGLLFSV